MAEITGNRQQMMEKLGVDNEETYINKVECIAWWYLYAMSEGFEISAKKQINPIRYIELDLPIKIDGGNEND